MDLAELLTVEERFPLSRQGLIVMPDFPVPNEGWSDVEATGKLVTPEGRETSVLLRFATSHFNIADPEVPIWQRWRVVVSLSELMKQDVPIGSRLFAPVDICDRLASL